MPDPTSTAELGHALGVLDQLEHLPVDVRAEPAVERDGLALARAARLAAAVEAQMADYHRAELARHEVRQATVSGDRGRGGEGGTGMTGADLTQAAELTRLYGLLDKLAEDGPCGFDHHGYCQEHGWLDEGRCPHAEADEVLRAAGVRT